MISSIKTLINFSSGIESTYCLYNFLNTTSDPIVVHHCNLINSEKRYGPELISTKKIIAFLNNLYPDRIIYLESTFDYLSFGYIIKDIEVLGFFTGTILRNPRYQNINTIILPANNTDESTIPGETSVIRRRAIIDALLMHSNKRIGYSYPAIELSKKDLVELLLPDLFEMTWYCRRPRGFDINNNPVDSLKIDQVNYWKNCLNCKTCKQVEDACKELVISEKHTEKKLKNTL